MKKCLYLILTFIVLGGQLSMAQGDTNLGERIQALKHVKNPCMQEKYRSECVAIISEYQDFNVSAVDLAAARAQDGKYAHVTSGVLLTAWGALALALRYASTDFVKMASESLESAIIRILNEMRAGSYAALDDYFKVEILDNALEKYALQMFTQAPTFIDLTIKPTGQRFLIPSNVTNIELRHLNQSISEGIFKGFEVSEKAIYEFLPGQLNNNLPTINKIDLTHFFDPKFHSSVSERAIARGIISKLKFRLGEKMALAEALMGNRIANLAGESKAWNTIIRGMLGFLRINFGTYSGWSNLAFNKRVLVSKTVHGVAISAVVIGGVMLFSPALADDSVINLVADINRSCDANSELGCFARYYSTHKESISDKDLQKIFDAVITLSEG